MSSRVVEMNELQWARVLEALEQYGSHALAGLIRRQLRGAPPEPAPEAMRFVPKFVEGPLGGWMVLDTAANLIVATWDTRTGAEADAWHRNRVTQLEADEDRDWGLRR